MSSDFFRPFHALRYLLRKIGAEADGVEINIKLNSVKDERLLSRKFSEDVSFHTLAHEPFLNLHKFQLLGFNVNVTVRECECCKRPL